MRNQRLDILRAVAIMLVLGRHAEGPRIWKFVGWVGVDLFFVLSGFLISGLLFSEYKRTGGLDWKRFFIRRGFKIYPSFYVMIFVTFLLRVAQHRENVLTQFLPELFFYQSYQRARMWDHTWSLAVEEHFYILLPLLLLLLLRFYKNRQEDPFHLVPFVCVILGVICLAQRVYLTHTLLPTDNWTQRIQFATHLRIDSLFFGVFLGYLNHFHKEILRKAATGWFSVALATVSALLLSVCFIFPAESPFLLGYGLTALYLGFGGLLIVTLYGFGGERQDSHVKKLSVLGMVSYVGMHSYSIYLWHGIVAQHHRGFLQRLWPGIGERAIFYGYILISLIVGIALSRLVEFPMLHLRERLFPGETARKADPPSVVSSEAQA